MKIEVLFSGRLELEVDPNDVMAKVDAELARCEKELRELARNNQTSRMDFDLSDFGIDSWSAVCRVCGCTETYGCDGGCSWVEEDLCSQCVGMEETSDQVNQEPAGELAE